MLPLITLILFIFFIFYLLFGIYILLKMPKSLKNRIFFSMCLHLSIWSIGYALMTIAPSREAANFWREVASLGWCFVYSLWLDFAILMRNNDNKKWMNDIRRLILYIPSLLFFLMDLRYKPDEVIIKFMHIWKDIYHINLFEIFYAIYHIGYALSGIYIIYLWGRKSTLNREKKQANTIVSAALLTFILGLITEFLLPFITVNAFPLEVIIFSVILLGTYHAITKYQLMTITTLDANEYILGNISEPVFLLGNDSLIREINKAASQLTGYASFELIGDSMSRIISEADFRLNMLYASTQRENVKTHEVRLITKNKIEIPCLFTVGAITNKYNETLGMACIFHDITDRKNAEILLLNRKQELEHQVDERTRELKELNRRLLDEIAERKKAEESARLSEERLRTIIMQSAEGIIIIDKDKCEFLECNAVAREILSLTNVKLSEMMSKIGSLEYYSELSEFIHEVISLQNNQSNEIIKLCTIEHFVKTLEISVTQVGFGMKYYIMLTVRDITEQVMAEERNQHLAKMEAIGTLSGGIAHDFNNILAGIMGYTQLTLDEMQEDTFDDTSLAEYLNEILKLGERARDIISQILTFSKKSLIKKETVDLRLITEEVVKMLKTTGPSDIRFLYEKPDTPCYVNADIGEMNQLIMNLCINARLALEGMGKKGLVNINLSEVEIEKETVKDFNLYITGSYIQLEVKDNGCGMDDEIKRRIFEPFYTNRGNNKGTGLGLSVVHGIVSRMEGGIQVDSELGKGSTFKILLPEYKETSQLKAIPFSKPENTVLRILLVDDEEMIVNSVKTLLSKRGYAVTGVMNARDARDLFKKQPNEYDILITDQSMPDILGDELVKELRLSRPDLPAIICSGIMNRQGSGEDENTLYLLKPIAVLELITAIEKSRKSKTF